MIRNILHHMGGIERFGLVSICLFFSFFTLTLAWAFLLRKQHVDEMSALPLANDGFAAALKNVSPKQAMESRYE